ncbi:MAG: phosphonate C-P lyase system protein PhnH [Clostridium butyricum]|nr:phosphonate C-P lyase system protein PhnH [Clostridium butyricum]
MKLNMVHDIQSVYRKVLNAMAKPGVIENLKKEADQVDIETNCYENTFLMMMMLLDREVSFNVVSEKSVDVSSLISQMTYAKVKSIEEADYIFVLKDACDEQLDMVIRNAKIGDLVDPNKSATIIAEFKCLDSGSSILNFKGPGIKNLREVRISGETKWIKERKIKNEEYPLGVDLIYVDEKNNVMCIPRTTSITESEV